MHQDALHNRTICGNGTLSNPRSKVTTCAAWSLVRGRAWRGLMVLCLVLAAVMGCAYRPELVPAPEATRVPGEEQAATAEVAGVRVLVAADRWRGYPPTLSGLRALFTRINNTSGRPLRVRYNDFTLVYPSGFQAAALPPYQITATAVTAVPPPSRITALRFRVAPYYAPYYPGWPWWDGPFGFDPWYHHSYYGWWRTPLPSEDMLRQAIPEGVIESTGSLAGFLYFQEVSETTPRVNFAFELVDAKTGETFGTLRVPFVVTR